MDLTRDKREGARASWGELESPSLFWDLNFEMMNIVAIVRLMKKKRMVGVNHVDMVEAHIGSITML